MDKTATLDRLKAVEQEISEAKLEADKDKERILKEARREALEIAEAARMEAEATYEAHLKSVEEEAAREREAILEGGRREAEAVRARAQARLDLAVAHLVRKFEDGILNATAQADE